MSPGVARQWLACAECGSVDIEAEYPCLVNSFELGNNSRWLAEVACAEVDSPLYCQQCDRGTEARTVVVLDRGDGSWITPDSDPPQKVYATREEAIEAARAEWRAAVGTCQPRPCAVDEAAHFRSEL